MVVCKFFLEGCCRYGQNCRFEHVYGSKYSYHANAPAQAAPQSTGGLSDEQLMNQVQADVQSALKGGQWLLSSYAPFKEKPVFPGISDLSPEEARLLIYEAKAKNNVEQAVAYMNNLAKEARSKYEQLLTNSPNIVKTVRSLYRGESPPSPFSGTSPQSVFSSQSSNASSIFRSANQQTSSPFAQASSQPSLFGQNTPNQQATSPFGQSNSQSSPFAQNNSSNTFNQGFGQNTANSIFSQANANTFSPGATQNTAQSLFSQATQNVFGAQQSPPPQNFFGAQDTAKSVFAQANKSPFGAVSAPQAASAAQPFKSPFDQPSPFAQNNQTTSNVFQSNQSPANVFGQAANVFQQTPSDDPGVYSKESDLTPEDLEMYKADSFKLGFIPEIPPPHSLCV